MFRQNNANQSFLIGPLLDATGSPVVSGASVNVKKRGAASAVGSGSLAHVAGGCWEYNPTADEMDANTVGFVISASGATSQCVSLTTTNANPQDANSFGLARLDVAVSSVAASVWSVGTRTLTSFGSLPADVAGSVWGATTRTLTGFGSLASDTSTAVWSASSRTLTTLGALSTDIATAVWSASGRTLSSFGTLIVDIWNHSSRMLTGAVSANVTQIAGSSLAASAAGAFWTGIETGVAQDGGTSSITLEATESSINDYYLDMAIVIVAGTGVKQVRRITGYNGLTKVASVSSPWNTTPDATSQYQLIGRIE